MSARFQAALFCTENLPQNGAERLAGLVALARCGGGGGGRRGGGGLPRAGREGAARNRAPLAVAALSRAADPAMVPTAAHVQVSAACSTGAAGVIPGA